jgi:hypothetical protein
MSFGCVDERIVSAYECFYNEIFHLNSNKTIKIMLTLRKNLTGRAISSMAINRGERVSFYYHFLLK